MINLLFSSEKNTQFNREIFSPTRDFTRRAKKVAALEEITMDDFIEFYQRYLIGENRRKISSQVCVNFRIISFILCLNKRLSWNSNLKRLFRIPVPFSDNDEKVKVSGEPQCNHTFLSLLYNILRSLTTFRLHSFMGS